MFLISGSYFSVFGILISCNVKKRCPDTFYGIPGIYVWMTCHFKEPIVYPRLLLISFHRDLKPVSQATQHLKHCTYFKIVYIQNDSQGLIHACTGCLRKSIQ